MIDSIKKRANHRARIIEGQINALVKAINNEEYCVDVLTQSLAIEKSLKSLNKLILENHLKTHVQESMSTGSPDNQQSTIDELLRLYYLTNVRG